MKVIAQTGMTHKDIEAHLFANTVPSSLAQRLARPEEIAHLIVYLASPLTAEEVAETGTRRRVLAGFAP